ncbi:MAG TPA: hypothetical protein PLN85_00275 [archaeon]|nr:hypothetical protein [archaeon]
MKKTTTSNEMRIFLNRMRNGYDVKNQKKILLKEYTMRDLLKITRSLNEEKEENEIGLNKITTIDQKNEENKFLALFDNMPENETVSVIFFDLYVYDNLIFWGGVVDGVIEFTYQVTKEENSSGVMFDFLEEYSPDNPKYDEIIKRIENYYNKFSEYWRNEVLNK